MQLTDRYQFKEEFSDIFNFIANRVKTSPRVWKLTLYVILYSLKFNIFIAIAAQVSASARAWWWFSRS